MTRTLAQTDMLKNSSFRGHLSMHVTNRNSETLHISGNCRTISVIMSTHSAVLNVFKLQAVGSIWVRPYSGKWNRYIVIYRLVRLVDYSGISQAELRHNT